MSYQIPAPYRIAVTQLAENLLPIAAWLNGKSYSPSAATLMPPEAPLPWRAPDQPPLSFASLEILRGFELGFDDDEENIALAPRWQMLQASPLALFHPAGVSAGAWRAARGLQAVARFGPFEGKNPNMAYIVHGPQDTPAPVTRAQWYAQSWPLLAAAYGEAHPILAADWGAFIGKLWGDSAQGWPGTDAPVKSSEFCERFLIDLLVPCLGQHNRALTGRDPLWQRALLIEVGENRHTGNEYTPSQTAYAVVRMLDASAPASAPKPPSLS